MKLQAGADDPDDPVCTFTFEAGDGRGEPIVIRCLVGEAKDDFSQTGQVVWPGASILSHFLLTGRGRAMLLGRSVIEVGAGVGIPGLLAASLGASKVVLTDHNPVCLDLIRSSLSLLPRSPCHVCVCPLDWGHPPSAEMAGSASVILGADVIYSLEAVQALFSTIELLLAPHPPRPQGSPRGGVGVVLIAYVSRWPNVDAALSLEVSSRGMLLEEVSLASFMPQTELGSHNADAALYIITRRRGGPGAGGGGDEDCPGPGSGGPGSGGDVRRLGGHVRVTAGQVLAGKLRGLMTGAREKEGGGGRGEDEGARVLEVYHAGAIVLAGDGVELLADALEEGLGGGLDGLVLERQMLREACLEKLSASMRACGSLARLSLAGSRMGEGGARSLSNALGFLPKLTSLDISGNAIGDLGAQDLFDVLSSGSSPRLAALGAAGNALTHLGASLLVRGLTTAATSVDLASNQIEGAGFFEVLAGSECAGGLSVLGVAVNPLREEGAEGLCEAMKRLGRLEALNLSSCWLSDGGAVEVSIGVCFCTALTSVDLSSNGISCEGAGALAEAIAELGVAGRAGGDANTKSAPFAQVTRPGEGVPFQEAAAEQARPCGGDADSASHRPPSGEGDADGGRRAAVRGLRLGMRRNDVDGEGALLLARAASSRLMSVEVDLRDNPVGDEGGARMLKGCASPRTHRLASGEGEGHGEWEGEAKGVLHLGECGVGGHVGGQLVEAWRKQGLEVRL